VKGAAGRRLRLSRVTIPVGGKIALHHHQGTQVAYIQAGVLTGGETGRINAGEWIVEQPSTIHQAANKGKAKIVIYLATLLKAGAPPSTPNT
jgi:quercetin dioxygenase-like cupin family protein